MANDGISKAALQVVQAGQGQTPASSSAAEYGGGDSGGGGDWNDPALANARDNHKNRMERIKQKYSSKKQQAEDDTTEADLQLERIDGEVDRPPRYIHPKIHLPILAVWMLLELPFNSQAFQLFLRDSVVASTGMALIVAFIFMLASDFTGREIKRIDYNREHKRLVRSLAATIFVSGTIVASAYFLSAFRQAFLQFQTTQSPTFAQLLQDKKYFEVAFNAGLAPLNGEGWGFCVITIAMATAGVIWSAFCHDSHPDYEHWDMKKDGATARFRAVENDQNREENREIGRYNNQLNRIRNRIVRRRGGVR